MATEPWNDITSLLGGYPQAGDTASELWGEYTQRNLERLYSPPGCMCTLTTNFDVPADNGSLVVDWDGADDWDTDSFHNPTLDEHLIRIPAGLAGTYWVGASLRYEGIVTQVAVMNHAFTEIFVNGTASGIRQSMAFSESTNLRTLATLFLQCSGELQLNAGDELHVRPYHSGTDEGNGGSGAFINAAAGSWFGVRWRAPLQ